MHMQLPGKLLDPITREPNEIRPEAPKPMGVELNRLVLNRPGRKVKFYYRRDRCKRCYTDLSEEQVKALFLAIQKIGKVKGGSFVFDNEVYWVSPATKRFIA